MLKSIAGFGALGLLAAAPLAAQAPPAAPAAQGQASLVIAFTGIARPGGAILIALFDSEAGWGGGRAVRTAMARVNGSAAEARIEGLAPGRYGLKVFHDVDGDGQLGTNPFGIPVEPFAFSNNARGAMGPASWADAAFEIGGGETRHAITIE